MIAAVGPSSLPEHAIWDASEFLFGCKGNILLILGSITKMRCDDFSEAHCRRQDPEPIAREGQASVSGALQSSTLEGSRLQDTDCRLQATDSKTETELQATRQ